MQLRCSYCQAMFALSRDEMLAALQHMDTENLSYYDAHCPRCRRANRVERKRMELFFPKWKEAIKVMAKEAAQAEKAAAPAKPAPAAVKPAAKKPAAKKPAAKAPAAKKPAVKKPAAKAPAAKKPASKKPAAGKKTTGGTKKK